MKTAQKIVMGDRDRVVDVCNEELIIEVKGSGALKLKGQAPKKIVIDAKLKAKNRIIYDFRSLNLKGTEINLYNVDASWFKILLSHPKYHIIIRAIGSKKFLDIFDLDYKKFFDYNIKSERILFTLYHRELYSYKDVDEFFAFLRLFDLKNRALEAFFKSSGRESFKKQIEKNLNEKSLYESTIELTYSDFDFDLINLFETLKNSGSYWPGSHILSGEAMAIFDEYAYQIERNSLFAIIAPIVLCNLSKFTYDTSFMDYLKERGYKLVDRIYLCENYNMNIIVNHFEAYYMARLLALWDKDPKNFLHNLFEKRLKEWRKYVKNRYT